MENGAQNLPAVAINYDNIEIQRNYEMSQSLTKRLEQLQSEPGVGRVDSLRHAILNSVLQESYDRGRKELQAYVDLKPEFPLFQKNAARYVKHCLDLIQAIETKRHFPGLASLSFSKQQEIHERVVGHFDELKTHLIQIEKIEREQKLNDVRSTVWFVKALCNGVGCILLVAFLIEFSGGIFWSANLVFDALINDILNFAAKFISI